MGNVGYKQFLDDLRAKRDALDQTIRGIEKLIALGIELPGASSVSRQQELPMPTPAGAYANTTILAGSVEVLRKRRPLSIQEIAAELEQGGFPHKSADFPNNVRSVLSRSATAGKGVKKLDNGLWDLHPSSLTSAS